jgi:hypothetical protein
MDLSRAARGEASRRAAGVAFALGCSLLRLGLFVFPPERLGVDPILALVASAVPAYDLACTLQG